MAEWAARYDTCTTQVDIKNQTTAFAPFKAAINKLIAGMKAANLEMKKAIKSRADAIANSRREAAAPAAAKGKSKGKAKAGYIPSFVELMAEVATPLHQFSHGKFLIEAPQWFRKIGTEKLDESPPFENCVYPYLMSKVPFANLGEGRVKQHADQFAKDFAQSTYRTQVGRGARSNPPAESQDSESLADSNDFLLTKCAELVPPGSVLSPSIDAEKNGHWE